MENLRRSSVSLTSLNLMCCRSARWDRDNGLRSAVTNDIHFYIQNESAVRGKDRLDLDIDPPPDLALEIDVTSRTHPNIYEALGVRELWRFEKGLLQIDIS